MGHAHRSGDCIAFFGTKVDVFGESNFVFSQALDK